jgi:hypothetical protein
VAEAEKCLNSLSPSPEFLAISRSDPERSPLFPKDR